MARSASQPVAKSAAPSRWARMFGIDERSLALGRILIAGVLLYDLLSRLPDLVAMNTQQGIMPIDAWRDHFAATWRWSLHAWHGGFYFQLSLIAVAVVFAAALLVGYRTRWACAVSWLLLTSLQTRTPLLVSGGDVIMLMLLFWGMFLPLGRRWSLDQWGRRLHHAARPNAAESSPHLRGGGPLIVSAATAAILIQIAFMYFATGLVKWNEPWLQGTALQHVMQYDVVTRPAARWFAQFPTLLTALNYGTLTLETLGPFCFFVPWANSRFRLLTTWAFMSLHAGIELTMRVIIFSYICPAALTLFLPAAFWEWRPVARFVAAVERFGERMTGGLPRWAAPRPWTWPAAATTYRPLVSAACLMLLAYVVVANSINMVVGPAFRTRAPAAVVAVGDFLNLWQRWSMFSHPDEYDVRFVALAERDGKLIDVLHDGVEVDLNRLESISPHFRSPRWMLAFRELTDEYNSGFRQAVAEYLYWDWNARHDESDRIDLLDLKAIHYSQADADLGLFQILDYGRVDALAQGRYRLGKRDGVWTFRYPNGQTAATGRYLNGQEQGLWRYWREDGTLESEGHYDDGRRTGPWTISGLDGEQQTLVYRDGEAEE